MSQTDRSSAVGTGCVVLGVHRSGTSAVAGTLDALGVDLGGGLMPGQEGHNPKGYFESLDLVALNDRILAASGSSWHALTAPPREWFDSYDAREFEGALRRLLSARFSGSRLWAVKDPRLCRVLPLWRRALDREARFLIVLRAPSEVARSLLLRNGFSSEKSALLWLDHVLPAERETRGAERSFLEYAALLRDPLGELDRVADELSLEWPGRDGADERLDEFLDESLRHGVDEGAKEGASPLVSLADEVYRAWAAGTLEPHAASAWDEYTARFEALRADRDLLLAAHVSQAVNEARSEIRVLEDVIAERSTWIELLNDRIDALQHQIRDGELELARQARETDELRQQMVELSSVFDGLRAEVGGVEGRFEEHQAVLASEVQAHRVVAEHGRNLAEMLWTSKPWRAYLRLGRLKRRLQGQVPPPVPTAPVPTALGPKPPGLIAKRSDRAPKVDGQPNASVPADQPISLPSVERPVVSIVIPVYNQIDFTWQCLHSIATTPTEVPYEVLVVDDLSTDDTRERLADVENLRLVCKEENSGFIGSCNRGAEESRGEYVLFLNNDTTVTEGWLDALVATFDLFPDVGMVGGKLVFPDGSLQEAGGIVWRDGSAWNFGRGQHPDAPEYSYARPADYCSGACLMLSRELFLELGMFDRVYSPAYYEDVDLAFRVRSVGKRVIYQPHCQIFHYEGASCGTDLESGVKQYQAENGKKFFARWRDTLATHRANGVQPEREKERDVERRALIIDHRMPAPDQDAGSLRMDAIVEILRGEGWKVTFLPDNLDPAQPYTRDLQMRGVEVVHGPFVHSVKQHLETAGSLYDVVILSRAHIASKHIDDVRRFAPQAMTLFDTVDLHFVRERRQAELEGDRDLMRRAEKTRETELSAARRATKTIVVSNIEREVLNEHDPALDVAVVSTIYDPTPPKKSFAERSGALFIGGFEHTPNVDAVVWLVGEILPKVLVGRPDFHLYIVGSKPTSEVLDLASSSVTVTGFVPKVDPYLERCRLSVAPLRFGAGVKGKLTQSLAHGVPCIATPLAAEGMGLCDEIDVLLGESAEEFAEQILRAHEDEEIWSTLSEGGLRHTEENASMAVARRHLLAALDASPATVGVR